MINDRLDLVEQLLIAESCRSDIAALLRRSSDTLRLLQRFSIGKGDADDLVALAKTMEITRNISLTIEHHLSNSGAAQTTPNHKPESSNALENLLRRFDLEGPSQLSKRINDAIDEDGLSQRHLAEEAEAESIIQLANEKTTNEGEEPGPTRTRRATKAIPANAINPEEDIGEIWIMRKNATKTLTRAHANLADIMAERWNLTTTLRTELGSNTLSLKWTPQLGHFCHVRGKDARATPEAARSISSTKSTRTFYLSEWTSLGSRLDDAKLRIRTEEQRVFNELRKEVIGNMVKLRRNAAVLDELDVACSSAVLAAERNLVKPILHAG